jgi:hypothetical protein
MARARASSYAYNASSYVVAFVVALAFVRIGCASMGSRPSASMAREAENDVACERTVEEGYKGVRR